MRTNLQHTWVNDHEGVGNTNRGGESVFLFNCYFYQLNHLYLEHKMNNRNK